MQNYYKAIGFGLVVKYLNSMYDTLGSILIDNICKKNVIIRKMLTNWTIRPKMLFEWFEIFSIINFRKASRLFI
jgi:hypothetical protein